MSLGFSEYVSSGAHIKSNKQKLFELIFEKPWSSVIDVTGLQLADGMVEFCDDGLFHYGDANGNIYTWNTFTNEWHPRNFDTNSQRKQQAIQKFST